MKIENRKIRFSIFLIVALKPFLYLFRFIAMNKLEDIIRYEQFDNLEFIASQIVLSPVCTGVLIMVFL